MVSQYSKSNFWNKLRVEKNFRYEDLKELFPSITNSSSIGLWFSGQTMPNDERIRTLCEFFDVPFDKGKAEFRKAHEAWISSKHKGARTVNGTGEAHIVETNGRGDAYIGKNKETDIFAMVYGAIPYDLFRKFCDLVAENNANALELIYGKVTFHEFIEIQAIIGGKE